jgi:hypothetical protein
MNSRRGMQTLMNTAGNRQCVAGIGSCSMAPGSAGDGSGAGHRQVPGTEARNNRAPPKTSEA